MLRKKIIPLILAATLALSIGLIGCGNNNNNNGTNGTNGTNTVTEDIKDAAKDTGDDVAELWNKVTDNQMNYTADEVKRDLVGKGYELKEVTDTKVSDTYNLFSNKGKTYDINGEYLTIYEFKESDEAGMKDAVNSITNEGKKISNKDVSWASSPHVYKKGRVLAIYDGKNTDVLSALKDVLGNPILG